ncbi:MAG: isoaspartyl peptidase/L-asparaginase [Planctomycetes bacterium]|nr:isoaspartyl peptidase/L-asparaginase [Planctomycetota bacterium]
MTDPVILAHGGAGAPNEDSDGPQHAADVAFRTLIDGQIDSALRAVVEAAVILENDERFNAGTGANCRLDGSIEMDAIVATSDGRIGSIAGIQRVRNPIRVARLVMDSPHVLLCGDGATQFAHHRGVPDDIPMTDRAAKRLATALERLKSGDVRPTEQKWRGRDMHGTIGGVARAHDGTVAVSCSTGGTSMMLPGRVGDSPIFGAGTMCGEHGAVCATGDGEEIIRRLCSMRVYLRIADGMHPQKACEIEVAAFPSPYTLGLIAVIRDAHGMAATDNKMARGMTGSTTT